MRSNVSISGLPRALRAHRSSAHLRHEITPFILDDKRRTEYLKGIREWDMDKTTLFTPCLEAQARFQAQIDLQKLQEYAQRYKPADYKED